MRERQAVQHVVEATVQPCLAGHVVVLGIDLFVVNTCKVATQAGDLLYQATLSRGHELAITPVPQFIAMGDRPRNAGAVGLDRVCGDEIRLERR